MKIPDEILKKAWIAGTTAGRKDWVRRHPKERAHYLDTPKQSWEDQDKNGCANRAGIKASAEVLLKWYDKQKPRRTK